MGSGADALGTKTCDAEEGGWRMEIFRRAGWWSLRAGIGGVLGGSRWFSGRWQVASGCFEGRGCWGVQWGLWPAAPFGTLADRDQKHAGSAWPGTSGDSRQTGGSRCAVGFVGKPGTTHRRVSLQRRSRQAIDKIDNGATMRCDALPSEEEVDALLLSLRSQAYASRSNRTTPPV